MPAPKKSKLKSTLNLTLDEAIKIDGRRVAWRRGKSLSRLVEEFIARLAAEDRASRANAGKRRA